MGERIKLHRLHLHIRLWKRGGERYEKVGDVKEPWNVNDVFRVIRIALE